MKHPIKEAPFSSGVVAAVALAGILALAVMNADKQVCVAKKYTLIPVYEYRPGRHSQGPRVGFEREAHCTKWVKVEGKP